MFFPIFLNFGVFPSSFSSFGIILWLLAHILQVKYCCNLFIVTATACQGPHSETLLVSPPSHTSCFAGQVCLWCCMLWCELNIRGVTGWFLQISSLRGRSMPTEPGPLPHSPSVPSTRQSRQPNTRASCPEISFSS